jgi:hypothetical protein
LTALLGPDLSTTEEVADAKVGTADKRQGGRKELADENLLRIVAREYLRDAYGFSHKSRTVTELCYDAICEEIPEWRKLNAGELDTIRRRLIRKFKAGAARDRVMIRYTGSAEYDARRYADLANRILPYLAALGLTG